MKNFIKLFVVIVAMTFLFISCEKGGSIEVTNNADGPLGASNYVIIVKGVDIAKATTDLLAGKGTPMTKGQTKTFDFDEDGLYTVVALFPSPLFSAPVTVIFGQTQKVKIE
ncbi:hypothetical protein [Treponema sp. R80B11-R83G3]